MQIPNACIALISASFVYLIPLHKMQIQHLSVSKSRDSIGSFRLSSASQFPSPSQATGSLQRLKALAQSLPALQLHHSTKRRLDSKVGMRKRNNDYMSKSLLQSKEGKWCPLQRSTLLPSPPKELAPNLPHYTTYHQLFPRWVKRTPSSYRLRRKALAASDKVVIF